MIKRLVIFFMIILILALISIYYPSFQSQEINKINQKEKTIVIKIIDGDTIETKAGTIRLLGINTPEKNQPYYSEAKEFLNKLQNQTIEILQDKEDLDKYNRKLRYIFYNNYLINLEIIEQGLATTFMTSNLIYQDKLIRAEIQAKKQNLNLWKISKDICANCIVLQELNPEQEFFIIQNICNNPCSLKSWTVKDDANHFTKLMPLNANQKQIYKSKANIWNDEGDRFFMRDNQGSLVIFYEY